MISEISKLLVPASIELELKAKRKPELIRELVDVLLRGEKIDNAEVLIDKLMERENMTSTGIGNGIAIPHCLTSLVSNTRIGFGRKSGGVRFDAVDHKPVKLFFIMVGPEGHHLQHLQVLSKIARYLHDQEFCGKLLSAGTPDEVMEAFREKERL